MPSAASCCTMSFDEAKGPTWDIPLAMEEGATDGTLSEEDMISKASS